MPTIIERFAAIVVDNVDDKQRGRIKVKSGAYTGDEDLVLPDFIEPVHDWGWFVVPDIGEEVEIEITVQDGTADDILGAAAIDAPNMQWRGKRFISEEGEEPRPVNELFTATNYGKRRGFATPLGHILFFDDTPGSEQVTLSWTNEAQDKTAFLSFDKKGSITLQNQNASLISLNAESGEVSIVDQHSNLITTRAAGIAIIDKFSNIIELKNGVVQVLSQADVVVNAGTNATVTAPKISLVTDDALIGDGADSPFVRHTEWKAWADAHTHPTAFGPSGPPVVLPPASIASTKAKVR